MPNHKPLKIEESQATVYVGDNCPIKPNLLKEFSSLGIIESRSVNEADYCLFWDQKEILESCEGRVISIYSYSNWKLCDESHNLGVRHIFLGSILGDDVKDELIEKFLIEAKTKKQITVPQDGIGKHYLIEQEQLIKYIIKAVISPLAPKQIYLLGEEYSLLTLAYHIRAHLGGAINVVFEPNEVWEDKKIDWEQVASSLETLGGGIDDPQKINLSKYFDFNSPPKTDGVVEGESVVQPKTKLSRFEPRKTIPVAEERKLPKVEFEPIQKKTKIKLPKYKLPKLKAPSFLQSAILVMAISIGFYILSLLAGAAIFLTSIKSVQDNPLKVGKQTLVFGKNAAIYLEASATVISILPGGNNLGRGIVSLTTVGAKVFDLIPETKDLYSVSQVILSHVLGSEESSDLVSQINLARLLVESAHSKLTAITSSLSVEPPEFIPTRYHSKYQKLVNETLSTQQNLLTAKALFAIMPDIIGVGTRRQYVLLLQNNMELRPTGGFIGSFSILSFDNGHLFDVPVYDVYSADGQLKGHVEPPLPIRKYLGEANWYLRDSNWDPDFKTTASRVEWYVKKTLNQDVDGVIGINLSVVKNLIGELGELRVPEYDEVITKDNIYARTQYHAEVGFFPGSTQKKEFISAMVTALLSRINTADPATRLKLGEALLSSVQAQDITLWFKNENTQSVINRLGWSGDIRTIPCQSAPCISSYLSVVDANVGVNKANYYMDRNINILVDLDKSLAATHTLTITSQNKATSAAWPAGPYKNYQRLYLPESAELISISRDGIEIPERDIDITFEHGKKVIGYLITTPTSGSSSLVAKYKLILPEGKDLNSFDFYWQKQPGTKDDNITFTLNHPLFLIPQAISPAPNTNVQQLQWDLLNEGSRRIHVDFTKE